MSRNLSPEEKKAWILENCINEYGYIDLSNIDFSDCDMSVDISNMKVKHNLYQNHQEAGKDIWQNINVAKRMLIQSYSNLKEE